MQTIATPKTLDTNTGTAPELPMTPATPTTSSLSSPTSAFEGNIPLRKEDRSAFTAELSDVEINRALAARRLLDIDPETFAPTDRTLYQSQSDLLRHIRQSTSTLFASRGQHEVDSNTRLKLSKVLSGEASFRLLKHIFGAGSAEDIYKRGAETKISRVDFIRCIVACAISDWVLEGHEIEVSGHLDDKPAIARIYERQIMERKSVLRTIV